MSASGSSPSSNAPLRWDLYARVIDNFGDAGVCLRLSRALRQAGQQVRLFIDDERPLNWMREPHESLEFVEPWPQDVAPEPGNVVIEAFGCELPLAVQARLGSLTREAAGIRPPPLWINLEYLSAEPYAARSHGLPSPVLSGPGQGCVKRFFFPGFESGTGGLLRQVGDGVESPPNWDANPNAPLDVSVFVYPHAPLRSFFEALPVPCVLHVCGGEKAWNAAQAAWESLPGTKQSFLTLSAEPLQSQAHYDELLARCGLNLVRGEDSFVRAQWAGRPMLWHIYAQDDGAHHTKLEAYLARRRPCALSAWRALNGLESVEALKDAVPALLTAEAHREALCWRERLLQGQDWVTELLRWAREHR